jgi:hypothetical protein
MILPRCSSEGVLKPYSERFPFVKKYIMMNDKPNIPECVKKPIPKIESVDSKNILLIMIANILEAIKTIIPRTTAAKILIAMPLVLFKITSPKKKYCSDRFSSLLPS